MFRSDPDPTFSEFGSGSDRFQNPDPIEKNWIRNPGWIHLYSDSSAARFNLHFSPHLFHNLADAPDAIVLNKVHG